MTSIHNIESLNFRKTKLKPVNKMDIQGVRRGSCNNCSECPQFISICGHVLCAYCGCPPARHSKDPSTRDNKRMRLHKNTDLGMDDDESSESDEASSGESSLVELRSCRKRPRRWRPYKQVTLPPPRVSQLLDQEPVGREKQLEHSWSEEDCSPNIYIKLEDPLTFHRNPVYRTTDAIRGKGGAGDEDGIESGYRHGLHVWSLTWPLSTRGTHPVVGVATQYCHLSQPGYRRIVGSNTESWGWCLKTKKVYHDSTKYRHGVPYPRDVGDNLCVPDTFYMILDMDRGTLAFQVNDDFLGVAFSGLRGKELFPIVSAVWGHCEVTLTYINGD